MKSIRCLLNRHKWSSVRGFQNGPNFGAHCLRPGCDVVTETVQEFMARTGRA